MAFAYDLLFNSWRSLAPLPEPLANLAVAALNGRIYAAGGRANRAGVEGEIAVSDRVSALDPAEGPWVQAGTLVCGVGSYHPDMQEVPPGVIERAAVVVDQREAAEEEAGEWLQPSAQGRWAWERLYAELGAVAAGVVSIPTTDLIYFKSCGLAIEDVAAGLAVLDVAEREGLGQVVTI